jgi:hypothetical protein
MYHQGKKLQSVVVTGTALNELKLSSGKTLLVLNNTVNVRQSFENIHNHPGRAETLESTKG